MVEIRELDDVIQRMKKGAKRLPKKCTSHSGEINYELIESSHMLRNNAVMEYCTTCMNHYFRLKTDKEREQDQEFAKILKKPVDF